MRLSFAELMHEWWVQW